MLLQIFEKLEVLLEGMRQSPPIAFIFMGNFMSESYGFETLEIMKKGFRQLGELISKYTMLVNSSQFVFVPGLSDPCIPHLVPK